LLIEHSFSNNTSVLDIPQKVVMGHRMVVVKVYEQKILRDEAASHEWVRKLLVRHREIIDAKHFIDLDLGQLYLLLVSLFLAKDSESELAIIHVAACKLFTRSVLLYGLNFDVLVGTSTNLLIEAFCVVVQPIHNNIRAVFIRSLHGDCPR
jgi:hypothetical protein